MLFWLFIIIIIIIGLLLLLVEGKKHICSILKTITFENSRKLFHVRMVEGNKLVVWKHAVVRE